jgi:hypothetical protein
MNNYLTQIFTLFKNKVLNSVGVERDLYKLMEDKDVSAAIALMQNRDEDVDEALSEYNPQKHAVMKRPNKPRKNERPYITEKLPRTRQRYINEVELFFLFGNPLIWKKKNKDGDEEAFQLFQQFLTDHYFDSRMRTAKRLAGAETESAKLYNIYSETIKEVDSEGKEHERAETRCNVAILARSTGYTLRPMFDRFGNLAAFAYGYKQNQNGKTIQHWDIHTADLIFYCEQSVVGGWNVTTEKNPTGKINIIYYQQTKAWEGSERRIAREEMIDSKISDTNNYFADPVAIASADVVKLMGEPDAVARLIKTTGKDSVFQYVNPPVASELQKNEKDNLERSILFDTFTPDFSFEALRGMGTLSGAAIRNSMILGYIKRARNIETYSELVEREKNLIIAILKYMHPEKAKEFDELEIGFEFAEPFPDDVDTRWQRISNLYSTGLVSLETAVAMLSLTDNNEDEIDRLMLAAMEEGEKQNGADETEQEPTEGNEKPKEQEP